MSLCKNHADADDLAQDVILKLVRNGSLKEEGPSKAWLFKVVLNRFRDRARWKNRRPETSLEPLELADHVDPSKVVEGREQLQVVLDSFQQLPETQRQVLFLRTVEALSIDEIAEVTGINRNSVKANLSHARKKMREKFRSDHSNEADRESAV